MKNISQAEVKRLIELRAKRDKITEELKPLEESITLRLKKHVRVAPGKFNAWLQSSKTRRASWKDVAMGLAKKFLRVDPKEWAKKTIAASEVKKSYELKAE